MGSPVLDDPYKILGVAKDATLATIRSAHRKLVLTCHPDKCTDETLKAQKADEFHKVQQAYELLSDEQKRSRYDQKVKLAELQADVLRESGYAKKAAGFYDQSPKTPRTGYWEPRPVVEIRPKPRFYEDTSPREPPRPSPRPSPHYDDYDHRSTSRRYEDMYDMPASSNATKKATSGRIYKDEVRSEDPKTRATRHWKEAAAKATADKYRQYEDKRRSRDKDRRQSYETKHFRTPHVESESETESEVENFMAPTSAAEVKRRYAATAKSTKRETDTRRRRTDDSDSSDDHDRKTTNNVQSAAEYIMKARGMGHKDDREDRQRPAMARHSSSRTVVPPSVPPPPSVDSSVKRSSARRGAVSASKSSPKEKKNIEIVEPASSRRAEYDSGRVRPNLASVATSPLTPKGQPNINKLGHAATFDVAREKPPSMRRVQTSPLNVTSPNGHTPHKSSKLRETHDSGYSSPGTPDTPVPPKIYKKSQYKIAEPDTDDSDGPTVVPIGPDSRRRAARETSPQMQSHRYERSPPELRASSRTTPVRSATYDDHYDNRSPPPSRAAPLNRAATDREEGSGRSRRLYGEVTPQEPRSADPRSPPATGYKVNYSQKYSEDDVSYGDYQRRGRGDSSAEKRDAYPYQRSGRHAQSPGLGSRTTSGRAEVAH